MERQKSRNLFMPKKIFFVRVGQELMKSLTLSAKYRGNGILSACLRVETHSANSYFVVSVNQPTDYIPLHLLLKNITTFFTNFKNFESFINAKQLFGLFTPDNN